MNGFISYSHEPWVMFDETCSEWMPNLAESLEISDDGTQFTFTLREGQKWSDGEPFTTDDVMFWYEAVATHPEVSAVAPSGILRVGEETATIEAVDDLTFVVTFPEPSGLFLANIALGQAHPDDIFCPDINAYVEGLYSATAASHGEDLPERSPGDSSLPS